MDEELPRTPAIFEEKTSWRLSFAEGVLQDKWADNHESAEASAEDIERQVREVEAGSMVELSVISPERRPPREEEK